MLVLAIDPGPVQSAYALCSAEGAYVGGEKIANDRMRRLARGIIPRHAQRVEWCVIEQVGHYGMPVGKDVFDTVYWAGRFAEAWGWESRLVLLPRRAVKLALCGQARAKDSHIRQAVIDRFGGNRLALGGVKCQGCKGKGWTGRGRPACHTCTGSGWEVPPGPLHGVTGDVWQALALGLTFWEQFMRPRL